MSTDTLDIQDSFLNAARKDNAPITIHLLSKAKVTGLVQDFDRYTIVLDTNNRGQLMIFKHAIATLAMPGDGI